MMDGACSLSVSTTSCFSVVKPSGHQQPHETESEVEAVMIPLAVKLYRAEYFTAALTEHVRPYSNTCTRYEQTYKGSTHCVQQQISSLITVDGKLLNGSRDVIRVWLIN